MVRDPLFHILITDGGTAAHTCSQHPCQISSWQHWGNLIAACQDYCHQSTVWERLKYRLFKFYYPAAAFSQLFLWQRSCNEVSICSLWRLRSIMSLCSFVLFRLRMRNSEFWVHGVTRSRSELIHPWTVADPAKSEDIASGLFHLKTTQNISHLDESVFFFKGASVVPVK